MKQWRVVSGEGREAKNMNTQGKLKSHKDLLGRRAWPHARFHSYGYRRSWKCKPLTPRP